MAQEFYITESKLYESECEISQYKPNIPNLKHGDIIIFNKSGEYEGRYRNDGVYIWNAHDNYIQFLEYEIDDYGYVPYNFKVGKDFLPDHWLNVIDHNTILYLDNELYENMTFSQMNNYFVTDIMIQNKTYNFKLYFDKTKNPTTEDVKKFILTYPFVYYSEEDCTLYCRYR